MRITYSYHDKEVVEKFKITQVIIGRKKEGITVDLDLNPDTTVSRTHARVWVESGQYWIEDLDSLRGTQINGEEIKGKGPRRLQANNIILIGETTLQVEIPIKPDQPFAAQEDSYKTRLDRTDARPLEEVTQVMDASIPAFASTMNDMTDTERRLALFYELPLQFSKETRLDGLLQLIVGRIIDVTAGARRGALMVKDRATGKLALKAHLPPGNPAVSRTLAEQAMEQQKAFIWPAPAHEARIDERLSDPTASIVKHGIESAMYAPLLWKDDVLGVVCVDNCETYGAFNIDDLRLLQALAHHAAIAVANLQLQEELRRETEVLTNVLKLVSPQIAERLKQHRGRIRIGGEFRDATILFSDIRGFTNLSATMSPDDVAEMLEDYFCQLVPIVFKHKGTIDKFVGDAILAVFGSPNEDKDQHVQSIRAAMDMLAAVHEVNVRRNTQGKRTGELGIGVHCGEVLHGFIGTAERMEFTIIGDTVNRASRYCDGARGREVLISPEVYQWVWNIIEAEQTSITTKHEGIFTAYRVNRIKE